MLKVFNRTVPIVDIKVIFVLYSTDDEIEHWIDTQQFKLDYDITYSQGLTIKYNNMVYMLLNVGYIKSVKLSVSSTILHEANHVCQYTFDICGFNLTDQTGRELHSYMLQWVTNQIENVYSKYNNIK